MKRFVLVLIVAMLTFFMQGCLYTKITQPYAYRTATNSDIKGMKELGEVSGEACNKLYLGLIAIGDGGYQAAISDALKKSKGDLLYNVKVDSEVTSILTLVYAVQCTKVTGIAVKTK